MITTGSLQPGTLNAPYTATLEAAYGTPPYTWTVISGSLPPGLMLNQSTGQISGTPTATGLFNIRVRAADSSSPQKTMTKNFSISVQN
jgi:hypothetical protein